LWERLAELMESNPVEVADYTIAKRNRNGSRFCFLVSPHTICHLDRIIVAVNKRNHKRTHKFGIEIPKTFTDCVRIDNKNGNTMWQDAVRNMMMAKV
jgi:hypothetical protein